MTNIRGKSDQVVLFLDMHEFSIAWRELGGRGVDFLQTAYERMGDIIVRYEGEIVKYMGDGMLCLFAAGSEGQAIEGAMELRQAYAKLAQEYDLSHDTELEVGISAGELEVGVFGHASLRQRDAFGEAINVAGMIGHYRGIAITESVYEQVKDMFETRPLPDVKVMWQYKPIKVLEIDY
jgi:class 3 adenylate cyclase